MNNQTRRTYLSFACMCILLASTAPTYGRLGETIDQIEARYGKPVSKDAFQDVDSGLDARVAIEEAARTVEDKEDQLKSNRQAFPELFRPDGTPIDFVGEDAMVNANTQLLFYDTELKNWENLQSRVIGCTITTKESDAIQKVAETMRHHMRQRFYIFKDIGISVVFLDGKSAYECFHVKGYILPNDNVNDIITKSFPGCEVVGEKNSPPLELVKLVNTSTQKLEGCATHLDNLTLSTTPYYNMLKSMEQFIVDAAKKKLSDKLKGF